MKDMRLAGIMCVVGLIFFYGLMSAIIGDPDDKKRYEQVDEINY
jgi:uncharacterized membrane protein